MQGIKGSYETDALVFTFNARFLKVCKKKKKKKLSVPKMYYIMADLWHPYTLYMVSCLKTL